jgi:tetratricopeptide (TPR) repeat protein
MVKCGTEILTAVLCVLCSCVLYAQEKEAPPITWQKDIESALKESYLTGRPLFLHFCPEGRIALNEDMSTFQDNRVKTDAQHFVWVRLDPEKYRELGDKYGVKEIPALVVVDHEKKKLNKKNVEGHAFPEDVAKIMKEATKKVKIAKPKDIEKLRKSFEAAQKLLKKKELKKAVALLKKVARFKKEIGFVVEAKKALKTIEDNARQEIEKAKKLVADGKKEEGDKTLRKIETELRGLDVASEARKVRLEFYRSEEDMKKFLKKEQEKEAQKLLALGQMYEDNKKLEKALEQYQKILKDYADTETAGPAADKVKQLSEELNKEPDKGQGEEPGEQEEE